MGKGDRGRAEVSVKSPLEDWHGARGARLEGGCPLAYGDPAGEAAAIHAGAALWDRTDWGLRRVTGDTRLQFLHNYLTQEVRLEPGQGAYACAITVKGGMVSDVWVLVREEDVLAIVPPAGARALGQHLAKYALLARVTLEDLDGELALVSVVGPGSGGAVKAALGVDALPEGALAHATIPWRGGRVVVARGEPLLGAPQWDLLLPRERLVAACDALTGAGVAPVGEEAVRAARVEAGTPLFGVDLDERTIPLEAGLGERAVSYTKGCYVGQEVIARATHRGRVNRHLRGLLLTGSAEPVPTPAPLFLGEKEVGRLTTCARSSRLGAPAGLGLVHRKAEPGARVHVGAPGAELTAEVRELPWT